MEKITPQPASHDAQRALKWLCEGENHGLDESGLTDVVRLLISKVNELTNEVNRLKNRDEGLYRLISL